MIVTSNQQIFAATGAANILSVSPYADDHSSLELIFRIHGGDIDGQDGEPWHLFRASTLSSALSLLRRVPCPVAICERDLPLGSWKDLLEYADLLDHPPAIVVTSRHADEYLWAEALNLGAYDVLAKPFDRTEIIRVLGSACLKWCDRHGRGGRNERGDTRRRAAGSGSIPAGA